MAQAQGCASPKPYTRYIVTLAYPVGAANDFEVIERFQAKQRRQAEEGRSIELDVANRRLTAAGFPPGKLIVAIIKMEQDCNRKGATVVVRGRFLYEGKEFPLNGKGQIERQASSERDVYRMCDAALGAAVADGVLAPFKIDKSR